MVDEVMKLLYVNKYDDLNHICIMSLMLEYLSMLMSLYDIMYLIFH